MAHQIEHRGENITVEDMRISFQRLKAFFTLPTLRARYRSDFEIADERGAVTATSSENALSKTLVISNAGRAESLTVQLDLFLHARKIVIRFEGWDTDPWADPPKPATPSESILTYTTANIMQIYDYLASGTLDSSESFENLPLPSTWYADTPAPAGPAATPEVSTSIAKMYGLSNAHVDAAVVPRRVMTPEAQSMYG